MNFPLDCFSIIIEFITDEYVIKSLLLVNKDLKQRILNEWPQRWKKNVMFSHIPKEKFYYKYALTECKQKMNFLKFKREYLD